MMMVDLMAAKAVMIVAMMDVYLAVLMAAS